MSIRSIYFYVSVVFLLVGVVFATQLIQTAVDYKGARERYAQELYFKDRMFSAEEWVPSQDGNPRLERAKQMQLGLETQQSKLWQRLLMCLAVLGAYGIFILLHYRRTKNRSQLAFGFIALSIICLYIGLFSPMLEIAAYERDLDLGKIPIRTKVYGFDVNFDFEKKFEGDLYFYYQSKSVVELIQLLFQQRNWVVAISILAFSILFPLSKIFVTLISSFKTSFARRKWAKLILLKSGKWSMADVFVAAMFLSFLAFSNMQIGIKTDSNALPGLYFFLAYCILSIGASAILEPKLKDELEA